MTIVTILMYFSLWSYMCMHDFIFLVTYQIVQIGILLFHYTLYTSFSNATGLRNTIFIKSLSHRIVWSVLIPLLIPLMWPFELLLPFYF